MDYSRDILIKELQRLLGGSMVDVELDPDDYHLALNLALDRYRQRSHNALEESGVFITVQPEVQVYTLPPEVQEVREIYRRTVGGTSGGGVSIDPFSLAFSANLYLIQNPAAGGAGNGSLALYDFAAQYQSLVGRMFGRDLTFTWDRVTKKLTLHRRFTGTEDILIHVYNTRPETIIFNDPLARPWVRDYSLARCKIMLGEAYAKFSQLAGPQGGITLKGDALKAEGQAELERLEAEIQNFIDGSEGWGFIIG
jgi:hypothetical protein